MPTNKEVANLKINTLKKKKYETLLNEGQLNEDELYFVVDNNEKTEYGDLYGNIENQKDLDNALYASRIQVKEMCNDPRVYSLLEQAKLNMYEAREETYTLPNEEIITIPYMVTRSGMKIVEMQHKELVDLLYEQTGKGNYVILDEEKKEFRLPLPDIYSLLEQKAAVITFRKWEEEE